MAVNCEALSVQWQCTIVVHAPEECVRLLPELDSAWHSQIIVGAVVLGKEIWPQLLKGWHCFLRKVNYASQGRGGGGGPEEGINNLSSALRMLFRSICPP